MKRGWFRNHVTLQVVADHYNQDLRSYRELVVELRKTIPNAKDHEITFGVVRNSTRNNRCIMIQWRGSIRKRRYPTWRTSLPATDAHQFERWTA